MADSAESLHLNFAEHFINIPAVNFTFNAAFGAYRHLKASNRLLDFALSTTERAGSFVMWQSQPFIRKFENQIRIVDDVACKGLEDLNEKAPVFFQPPEQILTYVRNSCNNKLETSKEQVKGFVESEIQRLAEIFSMYLSMILSEIEAHVEVHHFVPLNEGYQPGLPHLVRAGNLRREVEKIQEHIRCNLQKLKLCTVGSYNTVLSMVQHLERLHNLTKAAVVGTVGTVQDVILHPETYMYYVMLHQTVFFARQNQN